ncbi:MAG: nitrite reductase (NAD(P)H) small subunit, partial [Proteobacteria bacterium]|nr:nitrite reductase (NAD(P)H) small subunit [Pseudomonadota bacterium]
MLTKTRSWIAVCQAQDIVPNTGVCARVQGRHVAVFRIGADHFYAI